MDAGGFQSPHMEDLRSFTAVHVNSKLRKMRFEAYGVVAPYPLAFPGIKNACLKWAYKQQTTRGWCQLPPNIGFRLDRNSKSNMYEAMENIEECIVFLRKVASTVVEKMDQKTQERHRTQTKWIGEVDIGLMSRVFQTFRNDPLHTLREQEADLQKKCADFVALKLRELLDVSKKTVDDFPTFPLNEILVLARRRLVDPDTMRKIREATKTQTSKDQSAVAEQLVPRIMEQDRDGVPISSYRVVEKAEVPMEVIPWVPWVSAQVHAEELAMCKSAVVSSVVTLNGKFTYPPLAMIRQQGKKVFTKATKDIDKGLLAIPLSITKPGSLTDPSKESTVLHPHAVCTTVTWPVTEDEKLGGNEMENHEKHLAVQPEFKLPKPAVAGKTLEWALSDMAHPFWGITRQEKKDDKWNCEIVSQTVTVVVATTPKERLQKAIGAGTETYTVAVPVIMNAEKICADTPVILKWDLPKPKDKPEPKKKTWATELANSEKKRFKANHS